MCLLGGFVGSRSKAENPYLCVVCLEVDIFQSNQSSELWIVVPWSDRRQLHWVPKCSKTTIPTLLLKSQNISYQRNHFRK